MRLFLNSQVSFFVLRGAFFDSSIRRLHRNIKHAIYLFLPSLTKLLKPSASKYQINHDLLLFYFLDFIHRVRQNH